MAANYVGVTLLGGKVFNDHKDTIGFVSSKEAEFKGVFRITGGDEKKVSGVNIFGNTFDMRHHQLKAIAKKVANNEPIASPDEVYIARFFREGDLSSKLALAKKEDGGRDMIYANDKKNEVSSYPLIENFNWKPIDSELTKGWECTENGAVLYIVGDELTAVVDRTSYIVATSPEPSDFEYYGEEYLKRAARQYTEILNEARSIGWDGNDVLPLPEKNSVQFRDPEAPNVWKSPVKVEDIWKHPPVYAGNAMIPSSMEEDPLVEIEESNQLKR